ncbi:endonuclease/exonuclease/phosphatase family protein [Gloeothece verrucosa]|uniref:Endonuclease/exonuclease/phosphatase n=1 Tax=Gloeothece verrucosa (strain PCC 7822) TaxID=497965 RepID=E0U9K9_GLOV7|nr:endonuclease/exonuclease/phosphatase family protein [Gloeothece verrucosa]ADN13810.1 Endonuclease/exonuclease/phosphatase [Gloeothece verrucosa PCC 7822]
MLLKIITFNLRYDKPDPAQNNWRVRRAAIASLLNYYSPDLMGTQEGKAHQLLDLHRMLPEYQSVGGDRTGTGTNEHCAIFYHRRRLKCLETGDFFLSETPEIPGSITASWGNPHPRMVTWAVFEGIDEAKKIVFYNTHLDYRSATARELGAKLITERLSQLDLTDSYLFVTADFNATPGSLPRTTFERPLSNGIKLYDALAEIPLEKQLSFNNFTEQPTDAIDTIYYDSRSRLQQAKVDQQKWEGLIPSDHFPVIGEFLIGS